MLQRLRIDLSHPATQQGHDGTLTDVVSFYNVASTVLNHTVHTGLREAHLLYIGCTATDPVDLVEDTLVLAKSVSVIYNLIYLTIAQGI